VLTCHAEGTSGVRSAGRADKATIAVPKALGPRAYGRTGGTGLRGHHMARPGMGLAYHYKKVSKHSLS